MRRVPAFVLALSLLVPAAASAGPHLRWNACEHDLAATADQSFACDINAGFEFLALSLWAPDSLPQVVGYEAVIKFAWAASSVPSWWQLRLGGCRPSSLIALTVRPAAWTTCTDRFQGQALGGIGAYTYGVDGPNRARVTLAVGVPASNAIGIGPRSGETFVAGLRINHVKTLDDYDMCEGCEVPACIGVDYVNVVQSTGDNRRYMAYASRDADWFVTWQGGGGVYGDCPGAVPAQRSTWGSIKSLYR